MGGTSLLGRKQQSVPPEGTTCHLRRGGMYHTMEMYVRICELFVTWMGKATVPAKPLKRVLQKLIQMKTIQRTMIPRMELRNRKKNLTKIPRKTPMTILKTSQ